MTTGGRRVLLVEDDRDEADLTLLAFRMDGIEAEVDVARDGAEALEYLRRPGPAPSIILLDLKLPRVDGLEVLRRVRGDERTRRIPVIVLSTSTEESDRRRSAEIGVDRYVRKPVDFTEFRRMTRDLADTWLKAGEGRTA